MDLRLPRPNRPGAFQIYGHLLRSLPTQRGPAYVFCGIGRPEQVVGATLRFGYGYVGQLHGATLVGFPEHGAVKLIRKLRERQATDPIKTIVGWVENL